MYTRAIVIAALVASASAFAPAPAFRTVTAVSMSVDPNPSPKSSSEAIEKGWSLGGKAHTKDPEPVNSNDPRLVIPKAMSFEEYMKSRNAPAAPAAPVASVRAPVGRAPVAAPAAPAVDPNPSPKSSAEAIEKGWSLGGKAHTKDPEPVNSSDPRLVIPKAESFEEYMKRRKA